MKDDIFKVGLIFINVKDGRRMTFSDVLFNIVKSPLKLFYKSKYNIKLTNNDMKGYKGPALIIGNHVAEQDSQIAIIYCNRLIRMVAAEANLQTAWKRWVFSLFGVIPIVRGKSDVAAVRAMKNAVKDGRLVGIYPEAERTWDGNTLPIMPSMPKLAKMLNVPVYAVVAKGLHITVPRWAETTRRGLVEVEINEVLSQDEILEYDIEEIHEKMSESLSHNEFDWQKQRLLPYKGKNLAEGVERLLYACNRCGAINSIKSKGNEFFCVKCLARRKMDNFGLITGNTSFSTTAKWNEWQKSLVPGIVEKGFVFKMQDVVLDVYVDKVIRNKVNLQYTNEGLRIYFPKERRYSKIDIEEIESFNIIFQDQIELFVHGIKHMITFDYKKHMSIKLFEDLMSCMIDE